MTTSSSFIRSQTIKNLNSSTGGGGSGGGIMSAAGGIASTLSIGVSGVAGGLSSVLTGVLSSSHSSSSISDKRGVGVSNSSVPSFFSLPTTVNTNPTPPSPTSTPTNVPPSPPAMAPPLPSSPPTNELVEACWNGNEALVKSLLQKVTPPGLLNARNTRNQTALYCAVRQGHVRIAEWLLEKDGIDVNAQESNGSTPLHAACFCGNAELVALLLVYGCDTGITNHLKLTARQEAKGDALSVWQIYETKGRKGLFKYQSVKDFMKSGVKQLEGKIVDPNRKDFGIEVPPQKLIPQEQIKIQHKISQGYISQVFRANFEKKMVAIKIIKPKLTNSLMESIRTTITITLLLDHPNILSIIGLVHLDSSDGGGGGGGGSSGPFGVVTELGKATLFHFLNKDNFNFEMKFKLKLSHDIAQGLKYLHDLRFIHANLKSTNILVMCDPSECYSPNPIPTTPNTTTGNLQQQQQQVAAKIMGFSLLQQSGNGLKPYKTEPPHLPIWTAPEILLQNPWDQPVDVYCFGIILYEIFSRNVYFHDVTFVEEIDSLVKTGSRPKLFGIPEPCADLIQFCWDPDPTRRPTMSKVVDIICNLQTNQNVRETIYEQARAIRNTRGGALYLEDNNNSDLTTFRNSDNRLFRSIFAKNRVKSGFKSVFVENTKTQVGDSSSSSSIISVSFLFRNGGFESDAFVGHLLKTTLVADLKISLRHFSDLKYYLESIKLPSLILYKSGCVQPLDVRKSLAQCGLQSDDRVIVVQVD